TEDDSRSHAPSSANAGGTTRSSSATTTRSTRSRMSRLWSRGMPEPSRSGRPAPRHESPAPWRRTGDRSAPGLVRLGRLLRLVGLLGLVGLVGLVGLAGLRVDLGHLRVLLLELRHDLAEVLLREQALALHVLEGLAPALGGLHGRDLVAGERLG